MSCFKVKFDLITFKRTGQFIARDVAVLQKSLPTRQVGFVCALKETYGFIEYASHEKEVFVHYRYVFNYYMNYTVYVGVYLRVWYI